MRISVIAVGRLRAGAPEKSLFDDYARRAAFPVTLREVDERRPLPAAQLMAREGELLLAQIPDGATVIALERKGKALSSEDFAARLARWREDGAGDLAFVIGGADGLDRAVLERAQMTLSFGAMVWPHLLARVMLAEQLWRASAILAGHPYHRGDAAPPGKTNRSR
jgi:23S rRNA (pseudouridine1915-N3)-methyltransferase